MNDFTMICSTICPRSSKSCINRNRAALKSGHNQPVYDPEPTKSNPFVTLHYFSFVPLICSTWNNKFLRFSTFTAHLASHSIRTHSNSRPTSSSWLKSVLPLCPTRACHWALNRKIHAQRYCSPISNDYSLGRERGNGIKTFNGVCRLFPTQ